MPTITKDLKITRLTNHFFSDFRAYDEDTNETEETYKVRERFSPIYPSFVSSGNESMVLNLFLYLDSSRNLNL